MERATYSVDEAAAILGINRKSAYDSIRRHELPHVKIGARILVPKAALERFLRGEPAQNATAE
jgi:excisionase family DNA binding protein